MNYVIVYVPEANKVHRTLWGKGIPPVKAPLWVYPDGSTSDTKIVGYILK